VTDAVLATSLPHRTEVREEWIQMSDGCRLFCRIVLPVDAAMVPVPAVLEFLPYRLTDGTAQRDATHHPYFAGHGYAAVRVDMRGSGNSYGLLLDEYLPQEQSDAIEVIDWLSSQPWCSGSVGMYGKSWGGFNGLQVAAHRPPTLAAVISAYSTDDRYADDVHYIGGCVLSHEMLSWASYMLGLGALPPDPVYVGDGWRATWLERLRESPVFLETWLAHQRRDAFWRQGSICEDFGALDCGVLLVGGWADGYRNGFDRALAGLSGAGVACRGLVGPWSHAWPEVAEPGPQIGFLQECVRWWDHWLKGLDTGAMDGPLLRAWLQEPVAPATHHRLRPGRWVAEVEWPSPRIRDRTWFPGTDGALRDRPSHRAVTRFRGSELSGADAGAWCPYGRPTDFPPDQRAEDGLSLSFTSEPLAEPLEILGRPRVALELTADRPRALVAARLCDVAPDGASLLVSRGLLNLTHREGHDRVVPVVPGEPMSVELPLDCIGYAFPAGHRIRVAVSPCYWPFAWPSPDPVTMAITLGPETCLHLPERPASELDGHLPDFEPSERSAPPAGHSIATPARTVTRDASGRSELLVVADERNRLDDSDLDFGERTETRFAIVDGQPLTARIDWSAVHFLERGSWRIRVHTKTSVTATADDFIVTTELDAYEGDVRVHATRRHVEIARDGV
jgi:predicted acyl esterase